MNARWAELALNPPRGLGTVLGRGALRAVPEDFQVEEELSFQPAGSGAHVLLKVRKREANTRWVARELARLGRCKPADVGYAGLKDRHAVATQWFTVPAAGRPAEDWSAVREPEFEVLEAHSHARKLPRGALAANRFTIRIRGVEVSEEVLAERLRVIERLGVPNYFGPQRFGHEGSNLKRIADGLLELPRHERAFTLSAARSLIFNGVLAERVVDQSWNRIDVGDLANLDGRGSLFPVTGIDDTLARRCAALEIHPTGPLWGRGQPETRQRILELEERVARELSLASDVVARAGMEQERRALRVRIDALQCLREAGDVVLRFRLTRGSFATAVLRELLDVQESHEP